VFVIGKGRKADGDRVAVGNHEFLGRIVIQVPVYAPDCIVVKYNAGYYKVCGNYLILQREAYHYHRYIRFIVDNKGPFIKDKAVTRQISKSKAHVFRQGHFIGVH
jgi:hypothetical protein